MTGYETFTIYNALKLHFTTKNYDYFKYNGKSKTSIDSFEKRKDKYYFYKLSRQHEREEYIEFLVSNFIEKPDLWAGDLVLEEANDTHKQRMGVIQSLSYKFRGDCSLLRSKVNSANELFKTKGDYPILLEMTFRKEVNLETLCILSVFIGFFPLWANKINDTINYPNFQMKCMKYLPFLNFESEKFKKIIIEEFK